MSFGTLRLWILGSALMVVAAAAADEPGGGYVVRNVSIVDVERGEVIPRQSVHIVGDRITRIVPTAAELGSKELTVIDGSGLYLMPGLFDAHVHLTASPETFGPMLIANGVTCVRDTGAATDVILALREEASGSDARLPQIVCTGAIVDGDPPVWPFSEACDEPAEARAAVARLAEAGVDQIKVYSLLKKEVFLAAVAEAHQRGLKVTGHVPLKVPLAEALAAGQDCCEHLTGFEKAIGEMVGFQPPPDSHPWAWFAAWAEYPKATKAQLRALAERVQEAGMYQCPTLVVMAGMGRAVDPEKANQDPRMEYVPAALRSFWSGPQYAAMGRNARTAVAHMQSMVGELYRAGVPLMVGTDLANAYVFAGFSVHEEMARFQEAGIPPADVLRAATIVPARFCGLSDSLGTVGEGKTASLVLLRANPLEDVRAASDIESVFLRGRYFDRGALDGLLEDVKTEVAGEKPSGQTVDLSLPGEVVFRGRYRSKFQQFDAGVEDFVITETEDGFHIKAHSQPTGGPQPPSVVVLHVGRDFSSRSAEWRHLTGVPLEATYTREGETILAVARRAGEEIPPQELAMPSDAIFSAPVTAAEFVTMGAADLGVGEGRTFQLVGFGFSNPSWHLYVLEYLLKRHEDTTLTRPGGGEVPARFYTFSLETEWGELKGETWTNDAGVLFKTVLTMPMGSITVELE